MNSVNLTGRLVRDPELRHTTADTACTSFTLAVRKKYGEGADFIDCVAWRSTAEFAGKYFTKGQMVEVSGRLQVRDWTDGNGNKRRAYEVVADNVGFCGGKEKPEAEVPLEDLDDSDDGLPF